MKVLMRVDSSLPIGTGHVMRCLALADHLREDGAEVAFVCRDLPGNICQLVEAHRFQLHRLPPPSGASLGVESPPDSYADWLGVDPVLEAEESQRFIESMKPRPDWLLVDHYALDRDWETRLRPYVGRIIVIDDLANRSHSCDVLLDHNLNSDGQARYRSLVPRNCLVLCGPGYALLRPEFDRAAASLRERDGRVRRVLVFFGGFDENGLTTKACEAIVASSAHAIDVDVVVGRANPRRESVRQFCDLHEGFHYHCQVNNIAELMAAADLSVGAGGTTTWERAFLGLPSVIVPVAENQLPGSRAIADAEAAWTLDYREAATHDQIVAAIDFAVEHPRELVKISRAARALFGSELRSGAAKVVQIMRERHHAEA